MPNGYEAAHAVYSNRSLAYAKVRVGVVHRQTYSKQSRKNQNSQLTRTTFAGGQMGRRAGGRRSDHRREAILGQIMVKKGVSSPPT
jgi:hypothetical protein